MKRRVLVSIVLVSIVAGVSGCGPTLEERQQKANSQYDIGASELNRGNFAEALKKFEKAREINPDDPKIYDGLGLVYWYQKQYQNAIAEFKKALRLDPNFTDAHHNLGASYAQLKQWDAAIEEFNIATSDPFYEALYKAHYNLGAALLEKGENVKALEEFHKAIQIRPNYSRALDKYGMALYRMNRFQEAVKQFKKAIDASTSFKLTKQSLKNLGTEGLPDDVLKQLESLDSQEITDKELFLGAVEKQIGKDQTAQYAERILKYAEATPKFFEPYLNLGIVYMQQGNKADAIAQFKLVLEQSNDEELKTSARRYLEILE